MGVDLQSRLLDVQLMNLTSPSTVRGLLDRMGRRPKRSLGQNFLVDGNILRIILQAAGLHRDDAVLEVGAGLGTLTQALVEHAGRVVAVEKDDILFAHLADTFGLERNLRLLHGDMLELDIESVLGPPPGGRRHGPRNGSAPADRAVNKIVSNLPYSTGTRILVRFLQEDPGVERIVVTLQEEVAARLSALPGGKEYGMLTVWAQLDFDVKVVKTVSPGCFYPRPDVVSAVVLFQRRPARRLNAGQRRRLYALTKRVFMHRRKQMSTIFRGLSPGLRGDVDGRELLAQAGIDGTRRPEQISVDEWVHLVGGAA